MLGPALGAVAHCDVHVAIFQTMQRGFGRGCECRVAFHRIHLSREHREQCGYVARAGANFEDAVTVFESEVLEHRSNDIWLRDGLIFADRQRVIFVGLLAEGLRDELVARHLAHRFEHARVANSAIRELHANHGFALALGRIALEGEGHGFCWLWRPRAAVPTWVSMDR